MPQIQNKRDPRPKCQPVPPHLQAAWMTVGGSQRGTPIEWTFDKDTGTIFHDLDKCKRCDKWHTHYYEVTGSGAEKFFREAHAACDCWFQDANLHQEVASMSWEIEEVRQQLKNVLEEQDQERSAHADLRQEVESVWEQLDVECHQVCVLCQELEEVQEERDQECSARADSCQEVEWVREQWDADCHLVEALRRELKEAREEWDQDHRQLVATQQSSRRRGT